MKLKVTVHGVAYEVDVEILDPGDDMIPAAPLPQVAPLVPNGAAAHAPLQAPPPAASPTSPASGSALTAEGGIPSPIAGTVVEVKCAAGDVVATGDTLLVVEAMKMNTPIKSPKGGTIKKVLVAKGDSVRESQTLVEVG